MTIKNCLQKISIVRHSDHRGFFEESYNRRKYKDHGIDVEFVQDNHSFSIEVGTLRGLHFQAPPHAQAKLVSCVRGAIFDVAVDIRLGSKTYGQWEAYELTAESSDQLYIPIGYAHGFLTLQPNTEILYKCSDYYAPESEGSILWSDPTIKIAWPDVDISNISAKDSTASSLKDFTSPFIFEENS